jgi:hypothetical protein
VYDNADYESIARTTTTTTTTSLLCPTRPLPSLHSLIVPEMLGEIQIIKLPGEDAFVGAMVVIIFLLARVKRNQCAEEAWKVSLKKVLPLVCRTIF